jgi:hypothetical protein
VYIVTSEELEASEGDYEQGIGGRNDEHEGGRGDSCRGGEDSASQCERW